MAKIRQDYSRYSGRSQEVRQMGTVMIGRTTDYAMK